MQYYIVKKDDTLDKILNKFGLTYQKFISLNSSNINELIRTGNKILVNNSSYNRSYKDDINKIYLENQFNTLFYTFRREMIFYMNEMVEKNRNRGIPLERKKESGEV